MNNTVPKKVTADSAADIKLLKKLERQGLITIMVVDLENGKHNKKVSNKKGPIGVWGKSTYGDGSVFGDEKNIYKQVLRIVGGDHYQDARQLEAHYRSGNDIFVTEDKDDILDHKDALHEELNITVMSPKDLQKHLNSPTENLP